MTKDGRTSYGPSIVAVALLLLPVGYVGSYAVLLDPLPLMVEGINMGYAPNYRLGNDTLQSFYCPLVWVDHQLRPRFWHGIFILNSTRNYRQQAPDRRSDGEARTKAKRRSAKQFGISNSFSPLASPIA